MVPDATMRTYKSVSATTISEIQAKVGCLWFNTDT
ncbi:MAG: hypothetical protein RIR35_473, partial [Actinomycetota bacterium]